MPPSHAVGRFPLSSAPPPITPVRRAFRAGCAQSQSRTGRGARTQRQAHRTRGVPARIDQGATPQESAAGLETPPIGWRSIATRARLGPPCRGP